MILDVGIRNALKLLLGTTASTNQGGAIRSIASPSAWRSVSPTKLVWSDIFGTEALHISRAEAMTLPPVVKGRSIIVSQIAPAPLVAYGDEWRQEQVVDPATGQMVIEWTQALAEQPKWLQHTEGQLSPYHRMLWTVDDLIFQGMSLWGVTREDANDPTSPIVDASRIPSEWWTITAEGEIRVNDEPIEEHEVILFTAASEGLLEFATRSFRGAVALEHEWVRRAKSPIPVVELRQSAEGNLDEDEVTDLVQAYVDARGDENGTVAFMPYGIELHAHGETAPNLAIEARNFAKVDTANFLALPAEALDGSLSTASLTYSTQEGSRNEILDYAIAYWADPIGARLSQDDVVPTGVRVRSDFGNLRTTTPSATGTPTKD